MISEPVGRFCSKCGALHGCVKQSYCVDCHNAFVRAWRKSHPPSEEQRLKGIARAKAKMSRKRGLLPQKPCQVCGDQKSEMHHHDYSKPLDVHWLCRACHLAVHGQKASTVTRVTVPLTFTVEQQVKMRVAGKRKNVRHGHTLCSRCLEAPPSLPDWYCRPCRAQMQRDYRRRMKAAAESAPPHNPQYQ